MCRMILMLGMKREYAEIGRETWINNRDGWGIAFKRDDGKFEDWHVLKSNVPIPLEYLPKKVDGIFHIRWATSNREWGGIHPFKMISGNKELIYSHNGVIYPTFEVDVDSEIIGRLIDDKSGNLMEVMLEVLNELDAYGGTKNIIVMRGDEAFGYCDGSLVEIYEHGKLIGLASDGSPFLGRIKKKKMKNREWVYIKKEGKEWKIIKRGKHERFKKKTRRMFKDVYRGDDYEDSGYWGYIPSEIRMEREEVENYRYKKKNSY